MSKASISITKYEIVGNFNIKGYIDKPDLIGSFFGQTEGLIGDDLEFSSLQKAGKIGRIEIILEKRKGICKGTFKIPTALNKTQVSLVAAAIESIKKIGHCEGEIKILDIVDSRYDKREGILKRAEEILNNLKSNLPQTLEIEEKVDFNVRKKSILKLNGEFFAGPNVLESDQIILVEGRADVLNLLKSGIKNAICFNGSNISKFIIDLTKNKIVTAFLDSDKGGELILEELIDKAFIDFYCFAPENFEVEDLNIKQINKALKNKIEVKKSQKKIFEKLKKVFNRKNNFDLIENNFKRNFKKSFDKFENKKFSCKNDIKNFKKNINLNLKKQEKEFLLNKILEIKKTNESFEILSSNFRTVKKSSVNNFDFLNIKQKNLRFLLFNSIFNLENLKKAKQLNIKYIFCKKKSFKKLDDEKIKIYYFDDF